MGEWGVLAAAALGGLLAGSFLNVVIYRGPALWGLAGAHRQARGNFWAPGSRCPSCRAPIRPLDLAPLIGFIRLRGRCASCAAPIPLRYPLVEAAGALAAILCVAAFGLSAAAALAFVYLLGLITLAGVDFETGYLPDAITLPLVAAGLAANLSGRFALFDAALIGAAAGYGAFMLVGVLYRRLRDQEGLGGGDAKLLAAIGAWSGWTALAPVVFVASVLALAGVGIARLSGRKIDAKTPIRFGPALCVAAATIFLAAAFLAPV